MSHPRGPPEGPTRGAQVGGPTWGPSGWAHVGPKWVGPRGAQVGGPKPGPCGWAQAGPKWAQARNLGPQKNPKIKNSQNQNPFCPKCRQGFFMPEKGVPAPFGALPANFLRGPEKSKNCPNFAYFPWWANGPFSPALGLEKTNRQPLLLSALGGDLGTAVNGKASRVF